MSNNKQFGVWMDSTVAIIAGRETMNQGAYEIIGHVKSEHVPGNSNENSSNNHAKTLQAKFFKEITSHMQNAEDLHVTGTGKIQEQFINFLSDTPQFKGTKTSESTSNKMSDEKLLEFFVKNN